MLTKSLIRFHSLFDIIIPRACLICRTATRENHHLCQHCMKDLPILSHPCQKCAQFLHSSERSQLICGQCLTNPPPFDKVYALFPYKFPLPRLIAGFKFDGKLSYGRMLSTLMIQAVRQKWYAQTNMPDLIIPMPLHAARLKERGFNQAIELAKPVARALSIKLDQRNIIRVKPTRPQSTLPARLRKQNVANAFAAKRDFHGLHIAVVDDVMTTGQTVSTLARLLKKQGAKRVDSWCCARSDNRP